MSNTEMNRQIVQEGLNRRAAASRAKANDAAMDEAEKNFRALCNRITAENRMRKEKEWEAQVREQEKQRREQERKNARLHRQELRRRQMNMFICRTSGSVTAAAILYLLNATGDVSYRFTMISVTLTTLYFAWNVLAFCLRNKRKQNREEPKKCGHFLCNIPS